MKILFRKYLITILVIGGVVLVLSQANNIYSAGYGQSGKTSKYDKGDADETLTIPSGGTAVFTPAKLSTVNGDKTVRAIIQLEGADIRYTYTGTTPSASVGQKIVDGSWFQVVGDVNVTNFEAYGLTGTATAYIVYETESEMNKSEF